MGNERHYAAQAVKSGIWEYWRLVRGEEVVFLRGAPFSAEELLKRPRGVEVFVGDRFGWDGHRLHVGADRLAEIVEALISGQLPELFVEDVQKRGIEYHAPCGGG